MCLRAVISHYNNGKSGEKNEWERKMIKFYDFKPLIHDWGLLEPEIVVGLDEETKINFPFIFGIMDDIKQLR